MGVFCEGGSRFRALTSRGVRGPKRIKENGLKTKRKKQGAFCPPLAENRRVAPVTLP